MAGRIHAAAKKVPQYPGRQSLERAVRPLFEPVSNKYAGSTIQRLLGFWTMWHAYDGFDGLVAAGLYSRSGIHRQRQEFLDIFGAEVHEWRPEIAEPLHALGVAQAVSGSAYEQHRGKGSTPKMRIGAKS